jgi:hypothetical protein
MSYERVRGDEPSLCPARCVLAGDGGEEGSGEDQDDDGPTSAEYILSPGLRLLVRGGAEVGYCSTCPCRSCVLGEG